MLDKWQLSMTETELEGTGGKSATECIYFLEKIYFSMYLKLTLISEMNIVTVMKTTARLFLTTRA